MIQFTTSLKQHFALVTQTDTDSPTQEIIGSDIPDISFEYISAGLYKINKPGGWEQSKTWFSSDSVGDAALADDGNGKVRIFFESGNLYLNTQTSAGSPANNIAKGAPILIITKD